MNKNIRSIKEEIFAVIVIFFALAMVYSALEISRAADNANINISQSIDPGTLSLISVNSDINFNDLVAGQNADSLMEMENITVTDFRGTNAGWAVTTQSIGNFVDNTTPANQITLSNSLLWSPGQISNLNGSDITNVTAGADDVYLNAERTLMSASAGDGEGEFIINNTVLNFEQEPSDNAGNYESNLVLTVS
ncbi:WxL domain-containing protein [Patescibacteria group bacterium]|nr:WxL domain-containing protein [Patescibacteria group bacterium]